MSFRLIEFSLLTWLARSMESRLQWKTSLTQTDSMHQSQKYWASKSYRKFQTSETKSQITSRTIEGWWPTRAGARSTRLYLRSVLDNFVSLQPIDRKITKIRLKLSMVGTQISKVSDRSRPIIENQEDPTLVTMDIKCRIPCWAKMKTTLSVNRHRTRIPL